MLQFVALEVLLGGEALVAGVATERPLARVGQHVALDVGRVVGRVAAQVTGVLFLDRGAGASSATADHWPGNGWVLLPVAAASPTAGHRRDETERRWSCRDG